jgi:polyhydroxyalkanoate synthesis regulator phasin
MTTLEDVRKAIEATLGNLTPARAQEMAKGFLEPGAAKEQVAKATADMLEWSQRSRDRLRDFVRREIVEQMKGAGVATQAEVDALKKRVRELERAAGMTASGRKRAARKSPAKKSTTSKSTASRAAPSNSASGAASSSSASGAGSRA